MLMRQLHLSVLFVLFLTILSAQNEGNIWYFGNGVGLDFNSGTPVLITGSNMITPEGCASYCDADGNLLFYSNGGGRVSPSPDVPSGGIWNRNNDQMYDMQGLQGGGFSAAQSSIIIPSPVASGQYYLFTMEETEFDVDGIPVGQELGRGFSYFVIDMNLNGGLGDVVVQDVNVHVPSYQSLSAALHSNGTDYWVVIVDNNTDNFFVYELDENGLSNPMPRQRDSDLLPSQPIKISPDGTRLSEAGVLYNFNTNNGNITNPRNLTNSAYGLAFSPSSQYLYIAEQQGADVVVKRYETTSNNVASTEEELFFLENVISGQMQIAPDGKIYWVVRPFNSPEISYLHTIDCPNSSNPTLVEEVFTLSNDLYPTGGLPNFTDHIFTNNFSQEVDLGEDQVLDCLSGPITLDAGITGMEFLWSTGESTQAISVTEAGTYSVTVTSECGLTVDSVFISDENPIPNAVIAGETTVCPGDTALLSAASNEEVTYLWSTGATTQQIAVLEGGTYGLTVTDLCGAENSTTAEVLFLDREQITIEGPDAVCEGSTIELTASSPGALSYEWSNGDNGPVASIDSGGEFALRVANACEMIDTAFSITEFPLPKVEITADPILCPGAVKVLETEFENIESFSWSTGQSTPTLSTREWGLYILEASNQCGTATDSILLQPTGCDNCLYIPNAFSPNEDGRNDLFLPIAVCPLEEYKLQIFSRWGALVFETKELNTGWDGTFLGEPMKPDNFVWSIQYNQAGQGIKKEGEVILLR